MDVLKRLVKAPIFWIISGVAVLVLGGVGVGVYQYQKVSSQLAKVQNNPAQAGQLTDDRQRELIAEVSSKIMLPAEEKPTVAIVSDINRLKDQQFFANGQNGDVVLIYMNSKKAILYRPQDKKIVEVAPVNLSPNQAASVAGASTQNLAAAPSIAPKATPTVAIFSGTFSIRNGTAITGLAKSFETQLTAKYPTASVIERGNAVKRAYDKTLIIDVKGTRSADVSQIAANLGVQVGTLPTDEIAPAADFLIILGADASK